MKIGGGVIVGVCCAVAASLISVHFFLDPEPEVFVVESADGVLRVEGRGYQEGSLSLEEAQTDIAFPLGPARYTLLPEDALFAFPFVRASFLKDGEYPAFYLWDVEGAYWIPIPRETYEDARTYFPLWQSGTYALGEHFFVESPTFVDVVSELRAKLPEEAVSYEVFLVASPQGGASILTQSTPIERGGCGGAPFIGEQTVTAQESRTVQVLVNDVLTETTFTLLMEISITPGGCPEDMPLQVIF